MSVTKTNTTWIFSSPTLDSQKKKSGIPSHLKDLKTKEKFGANDGRWYKGGKKGKSHPEHRACHEKYQRSLPKQPRTTKNDRGIDGKKRQGKKKVIKQKKRGKEKNKGGH